MSRPKKKQREREDLDAEGVPLAYRLRKSLCEDMTQAQFAPLMGVTPSTVVRWEAPDGCAPSPHQIALMDMMLHAIVNRPLTRAEAVNRILDGECIRAMYLLLRAYYGPKVHAKAEPTKVVPIVKGDRDRKGPKVLDVKALGEPTTRGSASRSRGRPARPPRAG